MPVIQVQDRIKELEDGQTLIVTCTDPGVKHDIPAWCRVHGHEILEICEKDGEILITIIAHHK